MTTFSATPTPGTPWTWTTFPGTWSDAHTPWDVSAPTNWAAAVGETTAFSEVISLATGKAVAEAWATGEGLTRGVGKNPAETLHISEMVADVAAFTLRFSEAWATSESLVKAFTSPHAEAFATTESFSKATTKSFAEAFATVEVMGRTAHYNRLIAEGWSTNEGLAKATHLTPAEAIGIVDQLLRTAAAVISDIDISTDQLDADTFLAMIRGGAPVGYGPFKPYLAGDYQYQQALFREVISSIGPARPRIKNLAVTVDVPDVIDSGTVVVDGTGKATVSFARAFLTAPEVSLTCKAGANGISFKCTRVSETSFDIEVKDGSGAFTSGTFSWIGHGY